MLGDTRYDIDTATHSAAAASQPGWKEGELMPLQTNRRYRVGCSTSRAASHPNGSTELPVSPLRCALSKLIEAIEVRI